MTSFSLRKSVLTCGLMLLAGAALSGCAQTSDWAQRNSWANPSSWFGGGTVEQKPPASQTEAQMAQNREPPVPAASPRVPVQVSPLPGPKAPQKVKVALLLPLTGRFAALGQAMQNAAQQAVFDSASNNFELMPRDTGDGALAENAARDAVASGAQLLIGPLFAADVPAVKAVAENAGVNVLTLSNDVTQAAPDVFVMGFTPGPQVERVVAFAISHGLHHFGALLPANAYGMLVGQVFREAVAKGGGTVVASESYNPLRHDTDAHVRELAMHRDQIDALFLPEGGTDLAVIAAQLAGAGFDNHRVRLLGTGLWDEPGLGRISPFLQTGWYAASDPAARQNFVNAYKASYGQTPPRLATLAYDAAALAAVLAKHGKKFTAAALTNPNGFAGLDGIFRLTPDGLVQRGLAVIEVTPEGPHVIDPAPATFATN